MIWRYSAQGSAVPDGNKIVLIQKRLYSAKRRRDWSLPPPLAETGRRNVGNRKERQARLCEFPGIAVTTVLLAKNVVLYGLQIQTAMR